MKFYDEMTDDEQGLVQSLLIAMHRHVRRMTLAEKEMQRKIDLLMEAVEQIAQGDCMDCLAVRCAQNTLVELMGEDERDT